MKLNTIIGGDFGKQIISPILVINQKYFAFFLATAGLAVHGLKKESKIFTTSWFIKDLLLPKLPLFIHKLHEIMVLWNVNKLWSKKSTIEIFHIQVLHYLLMTHRKFGFCWGWVSPVTHGQVHLNGRTEDLNDFSLNLKNKYFPIGNRLISFQIWIQHSRIYLVSNF